MATLKHIASKNSDYTAIEAYLVYQHDEFSGKVILDEQGRPMLRESYLLDTLECGESSFAMACLIANRKYGKNGRREDVKTYHIWRHPPKRMLIYSCAARTAGHTKYIISFDPKDAVENGLTMEKAQALGLQFCKDNFPGHPAICLLYTSVRWSSLQAYAIRSFSSAVTRTLMMCVFRFRGVSLRFFFACAFGLFISAIFDLL